MAKEYEPLFADRGENAHRIWNYPTLDATEGTGIVHLAPAYGEEDYNLSKAEGFPFVSVIDDSGFYTEGEWKGQNVWEVNKPIAKELARAWRGLEDRLHHAQLSALLPLWHQADVPGSPQLVHGHPGARRELMLEQNENVNWFPEHLKEGRFHKNYRAGTRLEHQSRPLLGDSYAGLEGSDETAMSVIKVVGSYAELKELSGVELEDYHRPWVDDIEFDLDGEHYKRIDKVMDCWFESGSMPFAQFHYPFENKEKFEASYPGRLHRRIHRSGARLVLLHACRRCRPVRHELL